MIHKITALTLQKHNRQRVNVYLDGEFAFGLARIVAAWLTVGQGISDEKISQLQAEDGLEVAYQQALKFINYRPRTENEVRQNLNKHDVPLEIVDSVVERLHRSNLLNDKRFAQAWVENRNDLRPRSRRALAYELRQKGVNDQIIEQSLNQLDDEELAYRAARKQSHKYRNLERQDFRQKMYGFLARRGFNYEVSAPVVARVWAELHEKASVENERQDGWTDDNSSEEVTP